MKRARELLLENWTLKLTALLLALVLWLFVRAEPGPARVVAVPLEVQVPRNMEITSERPGTVEATLRGAAFSNIWFSEPLPTCVIDLQGAGEGEHVVNLSPDDVRIPKGSGIDVLQVNPARVRLVLERTISREVPVIVPVKGEPPRGFEIYGKSSKPATVVLTGPRTHVEALSVIATEAVSIAGQKKPVRLFLPLNLKDNRIRVSPSDPVEVDLDVGPVRKT